MNKPSLAALSVTVLLAGMSAASAGPAMSRDNANAPAAKMQSNKTQSDKTQSDKTQSDKTQSDKTQSDKTQSDKTQSDKTQSANAAAGDTLTLSDAQRKLAWQDLYMDSLNQNIPPGFDAVVGAKVPNTIVIAPVTAQAGSDVPALKPYSFAMVQKKLVIVNPSSRKIANVIAQ